MRVKVIRFNHLVFQSVFVLVALCAFAFYAHAEDSAAQPQLVGAIQGEMGKDQARDIISRQLAAIDQRDAGAALALTTEAFHKKHPDAAKFLSNIRFEFRPIYNHESYSFLDQRAAEGGRVVQKVEMLDRYTGESSTVIYRLEQQSDGAWLIDSFAILDNSDDSQPI